MPTSVPYFDFLAPLVTDIWMGSQNKKWELLISPDVPSGRIFIQGASTRKPFFITPDGSTKTMPTSVPNFNFLALLVSEIKRAS